MSIKGSTSDLRRLTKGGSLRTVRSDTLDPRLAASRLTSRDADTSSFLRRVVLDWLHKQHATQPSLNGERKRLNGNGAVPHGLNGNGAALHRGNGKGMILNGDNGNGAVLRGDNGVAFASTRRVPGWKYVLDVTIIALSFPFWFPVLLVIMLLTRLSSTGPIFYRQERIGLGGDGFLMWKFRTMKMGAETRSHERYLEELIKSDRRMTKLDSSGDPRLVPFGRILRASGLDELPQIFNVLRGEMSLVGPRPCLPNEFANYEPWQRRRVNALPGLTGYWQVSGKNSTTFNQMVAMDLSYVENMSVSLDLKIMLMTGGVILGQILEARN